MRDMMHKLTGEGQSGRGGRHHCEDECAHLTVDGSFLFIFGLLPNGRGMLQNPMSVPLEAY